MKKFLLHIYNSLLEDVVELIDEIYMYQELYCETESLCYKSMMLNYLFRNLKFEFYKSLLPNNWIKE